MGIMTTPAERGRLGQDPASGTAGASAPRQMIGRYRLTRRLGSGSFATVWQGHDDDLDVPVAVKVLADNWADNADVRNRFLSEARIMRRIRDPRIVRVYDIGTLDDPNGSETDRPYFVMDYADGGSLESLRKRGLPPVQALRLCAEASRALHVLHQHDVVHRDVTPGNILLNRANSGEMQVLIADLGVAKSMVGESGATMTAGTPAYMAIEQATGIGQFDHRADVYSLTAVTYAMLTGRPPFPVRTLADLLGRDVNAEPAPIAAQLGAPASLDGLILSGLSPQPGRRPPTATVLADALDQIANEMERLGPQQHWAFGGADPSQRPSPLSYPTPSSYLQSGGGSNVGHSQVGSGGYPQPHSSMAPQSMAPQPWAPPPESIITEPGDDEPRHGSLFYVFVGIALLALFFVSLLLTVVLRG
jgi:serine/threonine protein kinase